MEAVMSVIELIHRFQVSMRRNHTGVQVVGYLIEHHRVHVGMNGPILQVGIVSSSNQHRVPLSSANADKVDGRLLSISTIHLYQLHVVPVYPEHEHGKSGRVEYPEAICLAGFEW